MSGVAEAFAAVSFASNVFQFIDFGSKICHRIKEYAENTDRLPEKLNQVAERIASILMTLQGLSEQARTDIDHEQTTIKSCVRRAWELNALLDKFKIDKMTGPNGNTVSKCMERKKAEIHNFWKSYKSLRATDLIEELEVDLGRLIALIQLQVQINQKNTISTIKEETSIITDQLSYVQQVLAASNSCREKGELPKYQPIFMVPFSRNPHFVEREDIFKNLEKHLPSSHRGTQPKTALSGLGGIGKSQIALEYAFRMKEQKPDLSIFWVSASNSARFEESYKRIAAECGIPGRNDPDSDLQQNVRDWLETSYKNKWLMIVDNVDDASTFFKTTSRKRKALIEYVPQSSRGIILYTTRNRDIAVDLVGKPLDVPLMTLGEAIDLLGEKTGHDSTREEQVELVEELGRLPLAISQAAACMIKRRKSVSFYLEAFRKSDTNKSKLLSHHFTDHGRESRGLDSVATTWIISFELIRSENPRAAELLSLMSQFDRQNIPRLLILGEDEDPMDFDDAIAVLVAYSFITENDADSTFDMHRLVQLATQAWLTAYDTRVDWPARALTLCMRIAKSELQYELPNIFAAQYVPHILAVMCRQIHKWSPPPRMCELLSSYFSKTSVEEHCGSPLTKKVLKEAHIVEGFLRHGPFRPYRDLRELQVSNFDDLSLAEAESRWLLDLWFLEYAYFVFTLTSKWFL